MRTEILLSAFNTPWKISNQISRWWSFPIVRILFAMNGIQWQPGWGFYGIPILQKHRFSQMSFGPSMQLRSSIRSNPLGPNHPVILATWEKGACLATGEKFCMSGGCLCAAESIRIGNNVSLGANSTIVDTDFHPFDPQARKTLASGGKTAPVILEDDVFIGMNCLILKGVTIGKGSIIGAGSVVAQSIPAGVIAAGNPAKIIRSL